MRRELELVNCVVSGIPELVLHPFNASELVEKISARIAARESAHVDDVARLQMEPAEISPRRHQGVPVQFLAEPGLHDIRNHRGELVRPQLDVFRLPGHVRLGIIRAPNNRHLVAFDDLLVLPGQLRDRFPRFDQLEAKRVVNLIRVVELEHRLLIHEVRRQRLKECLPHVPEVQQRSLKRDLLHQLVEILFLELGESHTQRIAVDRLLQMSPSDGEAGGVDVIELLVQRRVDLLSWHVAEERVL